MDNSDLRYDLESSKLSIEGKGVTVWGHPEEPLSDHSKKVCYVFNYLLDNKIIEKFHERFSKMGVLKTSVDEFSEVICEAIRWHDMGKLSPRFQIEKLKNQSFKQVFPEYYEYTGKHSYTGSMAFFEELLTKKGLVEESPIFLLLPWLIDGHHTLLKDINLDEYTEKCDEEFYETIDFIFEALFNKYLDDLTVFQEAEERLNKVLTKFEDCADASFFYSYLYSLLTTADRIASMYSGNNLEELKKSMKREWKQRIDDGLKKKMLETFYREEYFNSGLRKITKMDIVSDEIIKLRDINSLRTEMMKEAAYNLVNTLKKNPENRVFFLNMPTGGGKTNASMKLALDIVENTDTDRIIYAMPFINIIEQNHEALVENYGLGEDQGEIRKIYSASESFFSGDDEEKERALFKDDFLDFPVMSMTFVRFFNTIIKPNKRYKYGLSSLTNSVVILDEIQNLPIKNWTSLYYLINTMAINYNMYFIIMSATLPEFDKLKLSDGGTNFDSVKLIKNQEKYFSHPLFHRTEIVERVKEIDISEGKRDELKAYLEKLIENNFDDTTKKGLIVLNTIKTSQIFFNELQKIKREKGLEMEIDLLNSSILPLERKKIIHRVKKDMEHNYILVSTQTIEAGVDVSFNFVVRDFSTLDSIEQVRGRCNRNGEMSHLGKVYIVRIKRSKKPDYEYIYNKEEKEIKMKETETIFQKVDYTYQDIKNYYSELPERINEYEKDKSNNFIMGDRDNIKKWNQLSYSEISSPKSGIEIIQRKGNIVSFFVATKINILIEDLFSHVPKTVEDMTEEEIDAAAKKETLTFSLDEIKYLKKKEKEYKISIFVGNSVDGKNIVELYKLIRRHAKKYQKNIIQAEFASIINKFIFQVMVPNEFKEESLKLEKEGFFFILPENMIGEASDKVYSLQRGFRHSKIEELFPKYEILG